MCMLAQPTVLHYNAGALVALKSYVSYCFLSTLDKTPEENNIISPFIQYNVNSPFFDTQSTIVKHSNHKQPLFLSLNTQSLQSKHLK